ncbi:MAG: M16 family metallopeptidase [Candidatus Magasanikbacteria bacterium]
MTKTQTLSNKTRITIANQEGTDAATILVMLPVGSRNEPEDLYGVSHFIEHMIFKGTEKRPTSLDISREIDRLGADYNAFTSKEYTGFYIKVASNHINQAVEILSDVVYNSVFDPEEMKKEKSVITEEINMYEDNPAMNIRNLFGKVMYKDSPLEHDIYGTRESVLNLNREDVVAYRDKYYRPEVIQIIGSGSVGGTQEIIGDHFGAEKSTKEADLETEPASFGPLQTQERYEVQKEETDQFQLMLGFPGRKLGHSDLPALKVLNNVLGANMSSRLFVNIREKLGLAYSIRSGLASYSDIGHLYIKSGLDSKNIDKALSEIKKTLKDIKEYGLEQDEFEDAKTNIKGSMKLKMEDSKARAMWIGRRMVILNETYTPDQFIDQIKSVSKSEVEEVAQEIFDFDKMRLAGIGDVEDNIIRKHLE